MLNIVIHNMLNVNRLFNMYKNIINFGYNVDYYVIHMFLRFRDKYALWDDIMEIIVYDLWLLALWKIISLRGLPLSTYAILHAIWTDPPPFCM